MSTLTSDEQQIHSFIDRWLESSRTGDLDTLLNLTTDDVLFLTPGNPPMRREDFIARSKGMAGKVQIEGRPAIKEITIAGDYAIVWNFLEIAITPANSPAMEHAGNILSVFRRGPDGQWRIWRDANFLAPVK